MDLKTAETKELKSLAFDLINQRDQIQRNLNLIYQELERRANEPKEQKEGKE